MIERTQPEIFVCSDWHLRHDALVGMGHRPENFSETICANLFSSETGMRGGDVLLHLGDVYLYPEGKEMTRRILSKLRADRVSSVLLKGNHDSKHTNKLLTMGWSWVCDQILLEHHGKKILFSHAPVEGEFDADYNVHGHLHQIDGHRGGLTRDGKHILISSELLDYRPIPLSRLIELGTTPARVAGGFAKADLGGGHAARDRHDAGDSETPQAEV